MRENTEKLPKQNVTKIPNTVVMFVFLTEWHPTTSKYNQQFALGAVGANQLGTGEPLILLVRANYLKK